MKIGISLIAVKANENALEISISTSSETTERSSVIKPERCSGETTLHSRVIKPELCSGETTIESDADAVVEIKFNLDRESSSGFYIDKKRKPELLTYESASGTFSFRKIVNYSYVEIQ